MKKLLPLVAIMMLANSVFAQDYLLPSRPAVLPQLAPFYHGVASGDPLSDRVIIWTRVTPTALTQLVTTDIDVTNINTGFDSVIAVNWQVATDTTFGTIVQQGNTTTDSSVDYTVKVDVTGLQPNSWYYYRFTVGGVNSITGRTRTLPVGNVDSLRFAVFSCSDYQKGYFNVYNDIAKRNDLDAVIHLGDYYYEYANNSSNYGGDTTRRHPLNHDAFTLADYRLWHSQYKLDGDLRNIFQQYPWIQIWDDHEVANNSWSTGADNHNDATEGPYEDRKSASHKAYFEWLPIREQAPGDDSLIHRNFEWGSLLNLIMLDTRYEDRDSVLGQLIVDTTPYLIDTSRNMLGPAQLAWFKTQLSDTTSQWKIIGNQVMIAPLTDDNYILNGDQWDGYPAERKRVFDYIMQQHIKDVVFVTGDIHSSWANDLPHPDSIYNPVTHSGSVATELVATSVTSSAGALAQFQSNIQPANPHVRYVDLNLRGYLLLDVNKQRTQGDFIHINTIITRDYTAVDDQQWMNLNGNRFLSVPPAKLGTRTGNPTLVTPVANTTGIAALSNMVIVTCFPNPTENEMAVQYYLYQPAQVSINVYDLGGRLVQHQSEQQTQPGLFSTKLYLDKLQAGTYLVSIFDGSKAFTKKIVKN